MDPGAAEVCDVVDDNDCDGVTDPSELDQDGDGFTVCDGDCNDGNASANPLGVEACDGFDNDCDPTTDENGDADGDGYSLCGGDCDEADPGVNPGAYEICDALDNDCDGGVDVGCTDCDWRVPGDVATITIAFAVATDGDVICADPGVYSGNLNYYGREVHVLGVAGPHATVLDGTGTASVVTFASGEGEGATLEGFTITGGGGTYGAGISVSNSSPTLTNLIVEGNSGTSGAGLYLSGTTATVQDVIIRDNSATMSGGGVYATWDSASLSNVVIADNNAYEGGGMVVASYSSHTMHTVVIADNESTSYAGGLYVASDSSLFLVNGIITGNHGGTYGGGVYLWNDATLSMVNGHVVGNLSDQVGGGIYAYTSCWVLLSNTNISHNTAATGGGISVSGAGTSFTNANVWGNAPDDFDNVTDPTGSYGNLSEDPLFGDLSAPDSLGWDLHLFTASPLVDAGLGTYIDPDGSVSDIGAYGGTYADQFDRDLDGWYSWWQPGAYDGATYPALGWDCDDDDPSVRPDSGC